MGSAEAQVSSFPFFSPPCFFLLAMSRPGRKGARRTVQMEAQEDELETMGDTEFVVTEESGANACRSDKFVSSAHGTNG